MKLFKSIIGVTLVFTFVVFYSCKTPPKKYTGETPTGGNVKIAFDESYQLLADAELYTFQSLYTNATINPIFASEDSILSLFLKDSVRVIFTSRKLTENEDAYLKSKSFVPRTTRVAYDALAFIVNKSNNDSLIRYNTIKDIFMGKTLTWKEINSKSKLNAIKVVFDNPGSSNVRLIMNKFGISGSLPSNCYNASKNSGVIDYVEKNPDALGIISVNWISDPHDSISHAFLNKVKVVLVTSEFDSDGNDFYSPHPAYIADKSYPFTREVYAINRETFSGLGTGFTSFVAGDLGQRIILRMGMVPAAMPVRLVEIKKK
jgi:phosphate transport system substrate-binding protein